MSTTARGETQALEQALDLIERLRDEIVRGHDWREERSDAKFTLIHEADSLLAKSVTGGVAPGGEGGGNG
jgi:hypothetical protein